MGLLCLSVLYHGPAQRGSLISTGAAQWRLLHNWPDHAKISEENMAALPKVAKLQLGKHSTPVANEVLGSRMGDLDKYSRLLYKQSTPNDQGDPVIADLAPRDFHTLLMLLGHSKARVRWLAASQLGKTRNRDATKFLLTTLHDPHWLVRLHAAKALGRIGDPAALEAILRLLTDDSLYVRRHVVTALGAFSDKPAVLALMAALHSPDKQTRSRAAEGLGRVASAQAVPLLAEAVEDQDAQVSWRAAEALARIGRPALPALRLLAKSQAEPVRYRAKKMLLRLGNPRTIRANARYQRAVIDQLLRQAKNFTGRWIGETQGATTPAHYWLIVQQGLELSIFTGWEKYDNFFSGFVQGNAFYVDAEGGPWKAVLQDRYRFIIPKWVRAQVGEEIVPYFDVIFSRRDRGVKGIFYRLAILTLVSLRSLLRGLGLEKIVKDPLMLIG